MSEEIKTPSGPVGKFLSLSNDSTTKTLGVALALCLVCSIIVSAAAVGLRPLQQANKELDRQKNILAVAGLMYEGADVPSLFKEMVEVRLVDLESGDYAQGMDPQTYDQRAAAGDPAQSVSLTQDQDIASIRSRAKVATVYLIKNEGKISRIILPVHGYGLWSTLYGFLAIEPDVQNIYGLSFYAHAETPGLGGEVDNPRWKAKWKGKQLFDESGSLAITVVKGNVDPNGKDAQYQVDGLAGATLTSVGVSNLIRFWMGKDGFGPYLNKIRS